MNICYQQLLEKYKVTKGYKDIRIRPENLSAKGHMKIIEMQQLIIKIDKVGYLLSEFYIEEWNDYKKFKKTYNAFLEKYF